MTLSEKAAYIKGLAEGLELDTDKKEARIINELLNLVGEMANDVDAIGSDMGDLYSAIEVLDDDLMHVEEELFGEAGGLLGGEIYEITCPNCSESVTLDEEMLMSGDVVCPKCGERIEIEIDSCDCGCGEHHHD